MTITQWPPQESLFDGKKYYIKVEWGPDYRHELRRTKCYEFAGSMAMVSNWEYYMPDNEVECFGALFCCDTADEYECEKDSVIMYGERVMPWSDIEFIVPEDNQKMRYHGQEQIEVKAASIEKKKKKQAQAVLKGGAEKKKPVYTEAQNKKWDLMRERAKEEGMRSKERYETRLKEDPEFAAEEAQRRERALEREREKREKKKRDKDVCEMFSMEFGTLKYGKLAEAHWGFFRTRYMAIGGCRFYHLNRLLFRKEDLYKKKHLHLLKQKLMTVITQTILQTRLLLIEKSVLEILV